MQKRHHTHKCPVSELTTTHTHIHTYTHTHTHMHARTHTHTFTHSHAHSKHTVYHVIFLRASAHSNTHTHTHTHTFTLLPHISFPTCSIQKQWFYSDFAFFVSKFHDTHDFSARKRATPHHTRTCTHVCIYARTHTAYGICFPISHFLHQIFTIRTIFQRASALHHTTHTHTHTHAHAYRMQNLFHDSTLFASDFHDMHDFSARKRATPHHARTHTYAHTYAHAYHTYRICFPITHFLH